MFLFIPALLLIVGGLIALAPRESRIGGGVAIALGLVLLLLASLTVVGTRNVGVVTTFGKPSGRTLTNGIHMKAPWQKVTDIDGTITTQKFVGPERQKGLNCIGVRIADGSTACVSVVIRSRVDKDHADDIYADYRNSDKDINDNVNDSLVRTQLTSSLATTFSGFNPLLVPGSVEASASTEQTAPNLQDYSKKVREEMRSRLVEQSADGKPEVDVTSITISYIYLSKSTQDRLNQLQAEVAKTRIAKQEQATSTAQAQANENLAASLAKNPNVLVAQCFDVLEQRSDKGLTIPAGFSCWPGGMGGVVLPAAR